MSVFHNFYSIKISIALLTAFSLEATGQSLQLKGPATLKGVVSNNLEGVKVVGQRFLFCPNHENVNSELSFDFISFRLDPGRTAFSEKQPSFPTSREFAFFRRFCLEQQHEKFPVQGVLRDADRPLRIITRY